MPRPWAREGSVTGAGEFRFIDRISGHDLFPLRPLGVANFNGYGRPHGESMPNAANDAHFILLEGHASTATMAQPAPRKNFLNFASCNGNPGGQSFDYSDEGGSV